VQGGGTWPRRAGLRITRHPAPVDARDTGGICLATPAETVLACARDLSLLDLVVVADAALHLRSCTRAELEQVAARRRRGAPLLRRALGLVDARSESAYETLLRLLHVACDVPVEPQHEVYDDHGAFVARGDLWIVGTTTLHEYDGADHLGRGPAAPRPETRPRDRSRDVDAQGVRQGGRAVQGVAILRDADASLGRPHRPSRIRAWHALLADSAFTAAGLRRLERRLG
jgi:hypothetical protein